jgi:hypothetical protein
MSGLFTPDSVSFSFSKVFTRSYASRDTMISGGTFVALSMYVLAAPGMETAAFKGKYSVTGGMSCEIVDTHGPSSGCTGRFGVSFLGEDIPLPRILCDADPTSGVTEGDFRFDKADAFSGVAGGGALDMNGLQYLPVGYLSLNPYFTITGADLATYIIKYDATVTVGFEPLPEPSSILMLASGVGCLLPLMRRHHRPS